MICPECETYLIEKYFNCPNCGCDLGEAIEDDDDDL